MGKGPGKHVVIESSKQAMCSKMSEDVEKEEENLEKHMFTRPHLNFPSEQVELKFMGVSNLQISQMLHPGRIVEL